MASRKSFGVVYERDGWRIERYQTRNGGEAFTITGNPEFKLGGIMVEASSGSVEVQFEKPGLGWRPPPTQPKLPE